MSYQELLNEQRFASIKAELESLSAPEASRHLFELPPGQRAIVFRLLSKDFALDVFEMLSPHEQQELLDNLQDHEVLGILEQMSADDRVRLLDEMPAKVAKHLVAGLTPERREATSLLLGYAPETAGRIMVPDFVSLRADMTVEEALVKIRRIGLHRETIYSLYVTDSSRRLTGVMSLRELVLADPKATIGELATENVVSVRTDTDQEQVARIIEAHDILAVPVVDRENRLVGIVTVDDALDVLDEEATEDIHRLGGVSGSQAGSDQYFRLRPARAMLRRLPWLAVLLVAGVVSATIIDSFESVLTAVVALAAFVPMVMDTAGNTGSQVVTLVVRALTTGEVDTRHFRSTLAHELATGLLLGMSLGVLAGIVAFIISGETALAVSIAGALVGTVLTAGAIGVSLPFVFVAFKLDPAVASAPLITTIGDGVGLIIYFSIAKYLYGL